MISRAGHIASSCPISRARRCRTETIGIYRYLGNKRWHAVPAAARRIFFHIGL